MQAHQYAISAMFFMLGLGFASWSSRVASMKTQLGLNDAVLGSVLFCLSAGLLVGLPIAGWAIARLGSRWVALLAMLAIAVLLLLIPLVVQAYQLGLVLVVYGCAYSLVNVANNTQASISERISGRTQLPFFHGLWGLAGFLGAAIGTLIMAYQISMRLHFALLAAITGLSTLCCWKFLYQRSDLEQCAPAFARPNQQLWNLALICFCGMACEGIIYDWSVVYFNDVVHAGQSRVGLGLTVFLAAMTVSRLLLAAIVDRFGLKLILQCSGGMMLIGIVCAMIQPSVITALFGFSLVGIGVGTVIPLVASAAAKSSCMQPSSAIAAVLSIGFIGLLLGPPLIGFLSHVFGLRYAFLLCAVLAISLSALASRMKSMG